MWFRRKERNRRLGRARVLDVKVRSSHARAVRVRLAAVALGVCFATVFGLYLLWRGGEWTLDRLVYDNKSFAIRQIEVQTDGVISRQQIRRWSGVRPGQNLFALDLARVKRDLELVPMIQSVSVERVLPTTLWIRVTEREPIAQVNVPRPGPRGGLEVLVFQLDADGYVMQPLDPRQRAVPLVQVGNDLPVILGMSTSELQPGRQVESSQMQAALKFIADFTTSPMADLAELKRIDVSSPGVLVVTTGQGSEITLGLGDFDRQLLRWQTIYGECARLNKTIATLNLAVSDNIPLRFVDASAAPPPPPKHPKYKKKNV